MNREELLTRLPEINDINDEELREQVIDAFLEHCPNYFWKVPASSSGEHHQNDVIGRKGLLIHTKRSVSSLERLGESFVALGRVTEQELDYARAGILLHDIFKQGLQKSGETQDDHDVIASEYLEHHTDLPEEVLECIHSHNGAWCEGKEPEDDLELLHHMADMASSDGNAFYAVKNPTEELRDVIMDNPPKSRE